jgi:serine/threonine-protein kinase
MSDATVRMVCAGCGVSADVPSTLIGRVVQCRQCGTEFRVEAADPADSAPPSAAAAAAAPKPADSAPLAAAAPTPIFSAPAPAAASGVASPASPQDLPAGFRLGNLEIVRPIGRGLLGTVYEAKDTLLNRPVAVKLVPPALSAKGAEAVAAFLSAIHVADRLEHPNILPINQAGREGDRTYLVEDLVAGGSVGDRLRSGGALPPEQAVRIAVQAARALAHAHTHRRGALHGNVHVNNLLPTAEGAVRLAGFGLCPALERAGLPVRADIPAAYLAPEFCLGRATDARSDVYSLGAVLYHLLTGSAPFPADHRAAEFAAHVGAPVPDPRDKAPGVPEALSAVVRTAMAKDPAARYASAAAMADALAAAQSGGATGERMVLSSNTTDGLPAPSLILGAGNTSNTGDLPAAIPSFTNTGELPPAGAPAASASNSGTVNLGGLDPSAAPAGGTGNTVNLPLPEKPAVVAPARPPTVRAGSIRRGKPVSFVPLAVAICVASVVLGGVVIYLANRPPVALPPAPGPQVAATAATADTAAGAGTGTGAEGTGDPAAGTGESPAGTGEAATAAGTGETKPPATGTAANPPPADGFNYKLEMAKQKLEAAVEKGDSDEIGRECEKVKALEKEFASAPPARAAELKKELDSILKKNLGGYYLARLAMKLPRPNTSWPGLESVPNVAGAYQVFDGKKVHGEMSPVDWETIPSASQIAANPHGSGFMFLMPCKSLFKDFELRFQMSCVESAAVAGPWYRWTGVKDTKKFRLAIGSKTVGIHYADDVKEGDPVAKCDVPSSAESKWLDVRIIVRGGEHTIFLNGEQALKHTVAEPARAGRLAMSVTEGETRFRRISLMIFDNVPTPAPADETPDSEDGPVPAERRIAGTGSGWLCAPGGYIMTNRHVVRGAKKLYVVLGKDKKVPATLVKEHDKRDMAIIKIDPAHVAGVQPLPIAAGKTIVRGEEVIAFGFPFGEQFGSGLKFTKGSICALPDRKNEDMMLLDIRINPGNSGGPLVDMAGNAVGMNTAKTGNAFAGDPYGMAVIAKHIDEFAKANIPGYATLEPRTKNMSGIEVDKAVSPGVFMIQVGG